MTEGQREFLKPEAERLLVELQGDGTSPDRRARIGERLAEIGDPRRGVGLDADRLPEFEWRPVPAGKLRLELEGTRKPRVFEISPFEISVYPVTWAQYRAFIQAADGYADRRWWQGLAGHEDQPGQQRWPLDNHPAENVSWYDAVAFSRWVSARRNEDLRLPTEWEWQWAATGGKKECEYPWVGGWKENHANTYESGIGRTTAVGMFPQGAAPGGAMDLSGNVWEWCLNEYERPDAVGFSGDHSRVLRGGSWFGRPLGRARAAFRSHSVPGSRFDFVGVRLVRLSPIFK